MPNVRTIIGIMVVLALLQASCAGARTLYELHSDYDHILLAEHDGLFCLITEDGGFQNIQDCVHSQNPLVIASEHTKALMSALLLKPQPLRVLIIGMGAGVLTMAIRIAAPGAFIETVEKDGGIERICKELFYYKEDALMRTYIADGPNFVHDAVATGVKYDLVVINALTAKYMPDEMMGRQFLESLKTIMNPGAVIAADTLVQSRLYENESVTYAAVFGAFYNFRTDNGHRIIVAANGGLPEPSQTQNGARYFARLFMETFGINVNELLTRLDDEPDWPPSAKIISDERTASEILNGPLKSVFFKHKYLATAAAIALVLLLVLFVVNLFDAIVARKHKAATAL